SLLTVTIPRSAGLTTVAPSAIAGEIEAIYSIATIGSIVKINEIRISARLAQNGLRRGQRGEHPLRHRLAGQPRLGAQQRRLAVGDVAGGKTRPKPPRPFGRALLEGVLEMLQHRRAEAA